MKCPECLEEVDKLVPEYNMCVECVEAIAQEEDIFEEEFNESLKEEDFGDFDDQDEDE